MKGRRPVWKLSKNPSRRQQWLDQDRPGQTRQGSCADAKRWAALGCMLMTEAEKFTGSLDIIALEKKKEPRMFPRLLS